MARRQTTIEAAPDTEAQPKPKPSRKSSASADALWIGEHAADGDILVLDGPATPDGGRLSYYSLTQLRSRVFPAAIAAAKIKQVTDEIRLARARKQYAQRSELEAEHEQARAVERADVAERQREQVIRLHEKYMEGHGVEDEGVRETPSNHKSRRSKCHACSITLDDFVGRVCVKCNEVLCSCGACACGSRTRSR